MMAASSSSSSSSNSSSAFRRAPSTTSTPSSPRRQTIHSGAGSDDVIGDAGSDDIVEDVFGDVEAQPAVDGLTSFERQHPQQQRHVDANANTSVGKHFVNPEEG